MLWDVTIDSNNIGNDMICLPKDMYDRHSSMYCVNQPPKDQNQTRRRIDNLNTKRTRRSHVMYNNELRPSRAKARQLEPWLNVRPNKSIVCKTQQYRCMSIGQPREGNRKLGVYSMLTWVFLFVEWHHQERYRNLTKHNRNRRPIFLMWILRLSLAPWKSYRYL